MAFVKDFETLTKLVAYGNKSRMIGDGLKLTPLYNKMEEVPGYKHMEDLDLEEKERKAEEKKARKALKASKTMKKNKTL